MSLHLNFRGTFTNSGGHTKSLKFLPAKLNSYPEISVVFFFFFYFCFFFFFFFFFFFLFFFFFFFLFFFFSFFFSIYCLALAFEHYRQVYIVHSVHFLFKFELDVDRFGSRRGVYDCEVVSAGALVLNSPANLLFLY